MGTKAPAGLECGDEGKRERENDGEGFEMELELSTKRDRQQLQLQLLHILCNLPWLTFQPPATATATAPQSTERTKAHPPIPSSDRAVRGRVYYTIRFAFIFKAQSEKARFPFNVAFENVKFLILFAQALYKSILACAYYPVRALRPAFVPTPTPTP